MFVFAFFYLRKEAIKEVQSILLSRSYSIWLCVAIKLALVHEKPGALGQEAYSGEGGEWICLIIYPLSSLRWKQEKFQQLFHMANNWYQCFSHDM